MGLALSVNELETLSSRPENQSPCETERLAYRVIFGLHNVQKSLTPSPPVAILVSYLILPKLIVRVGRCWIGGSYVL